MGERRRLPVSTLPSRRSAKLSAAARANTLVVLSGLLYAAGDAQQPLPEPSLQALATTLASEDLRASLLSGQPASSSAAAAMAAAAGTGAAGPAPSEAAAMRAQLHAAVSNLMRWQGAACAPVAPQLCTLLLALWGAEHGGPDVPAHPAGAAAASAGGAVGGGRRAAVEGAMAQLVQCCGAGSWAKLLDGLADAQLQAVLAALPRCACVPSRLGTQPRGCSQPRLFSR